MINIYEPAQDQLALEHYDEVVAQLNKSRTSSMAAVEDWFQSFDSSYSLKAVITAKPDQLETFRTVCIPVSGTFPDEITYFRTMYLYFSGGQNDSIGDNGYNAIRLMEKLGLRVCPLCNRNHIGNVHRPNRGKKRTSQLDHFHNKSDYPFLAMSFFNLIPSCPSCNHAKGKEDIALSPYGTMDMDPLVRIGFNIHEVDDLFDEQKLVVELYPHNDMKLNIEVLGLESLYESHNDVAFEIVKKFRHYTKLLREEIHTTFPGLYRDEVELRDQLFGSYLQKDQLKKQVLAKLKKDVFELLQRDEQLRGASGV